MQTAVRHECILRNGSEFETGLVHLRMGSSHLHFRAGVSHIAYCIAYKSYCIVSHIQPTLNFSEPDE